MQTFLLVLLLVMVGVAALAVFFLYKKVQKLSEPKEGEQNLFMLLQNQIQEQSRGVQELAKVIDTKITETNKSMTQSQQHMHQTIQEQFGQSTKMIQGITGQSAKMIAEITEKLTTLDNTNKQVVSFSEQLGNLEKVLTHQKQRGELGEAGLQLMLENMLPPTAYKLQYQFDDGDIVDAAIFTKEGLIPVDAKFSLDNYNRILKEDNKERKAELEKDFKNDLKKRIDETAKYIKPGKGTLDFAFMYIPAEGIYYDLLINEVGAVKVNTRSLIDYALLDKKVVIVSPTTFAAYLQTVIQGLRAMKIEESAKGIRKNVEMLHKHIAAFDSYMQKLGASMNTAVNHYNTAYKELGKIDKDVIRITDGDRKIEPLVIDRPQQLDS
ncbi:MAG: DNA recombination protein RmuC [Candidatus Magasanikbacteria bacterium CG11_big_fil_rev_8_21_14_0_20_39_34]|uniref:DNA recombination protein RmuC n=1 Tax=Candidatus Magasanikbacteria bacterium CG11_big_fil_rev_8_21_14_0_20_39_34 TaxID=1974653 RepID=A0A2H0N6R4_9BACT|nr:MAG: DNA recombination protein RmuC [Candidatus Magasanikbacteria bacterium CG11_big_fil_rev_8_21_14_0_20_39_34]